MSRNAFSTLRPLHDDRGLSVFGQAIRHPTLRTGLRTQKQGMFWTLSLREVYRKREQEEVTSVNFQN